MKIFEKRKSQYLDREHELCNPGETAVCTRTSWFILGCRVWFSDEVTYFEDSQFSHLKERIRNFAKLPAGWDSYDAPPISSAAIENCLAFIEKLESTSLYPDWVEPTCDGGIMLEIAYDDETEEWDFSYDGTITTAVEKNGDYKIENAKQ